MTDNKESIYSTENIFSAEIPEQQFIAYSLVDQNDPVLTIQLQEFDFNDRTIDPAQIASRLISTCKMHGVFGIAANQCGLYHKVLVAGAGDEFVAFFNPTILEETGEILIPETDLSNIGLVLHVKRPKSIIVQYQDYLGELKTVRLEGLTGCIVHQAIDRLNGIDFKTKVSKLILNRAKKSLNKKIKKFVRNNIKFKK